MARNYSDILKLLIATCLFAIPIYLGSWFAKVSGCPLLQVAGSYMAYCSSPRYGDFEHLAYSFGLIPEAIGSLKTAEVVMLGNSRTQVAFSASGVDNFFRRQSIPYHVLGFGYGEYGDFPAYLFRKYQLAPRVLIINADPFFTEETSSVGKDAVAGGPIVWADALMKMALAHVHSVICRALCWWHDAWGKPGSIYRSSKTGQWLWNGYSTYDTRHFNDGDEIKYDKPSSDADLEAFYKAASRLLSAFNVRRECVILTGIPTPAINSDQVAASLAARLGVVLVQPKITGMRSGDASHLTMTSADRWSAAFLSEAAPVIKSCTNQFAH